MKSFNNAPPKGKSFNNGPLPPNRLSNGQYGFVTNTTKLATLDTILSVCRETLDKAFPEYAHFNLCMPSEYMRRVGQSIAAASLSEK